jgi:hypothetical protein
MDPWPKETKWSLVSNMDGLMGIQPYITYNRGKKAVIEADVDPANCYTLLVEDSYGDGLVNGAYWQVYWNGDLKYDVGTGRPIGNFGYAVSVAIGNGCDSSGVKALLTMDSPSAYTLSHANSKEKSSSVQGGNDGDVYEEEDDEKEEEGVRGGGRGGGGFGGRGFQGSN